MYLKVNIVIGAGKTNEQKSTPKNITKYTKINLNYLELAKKLRNKNAETNISYQYSNINTHNSNKAKENKIIDKRINGYVRSTSTFNVKSTKDTSFKMINNSFKAKNDIDGPEELHAFYVNIYQQNKILAYKFENFANDTEAMGIL
jgi:hypothetical protein